jgi:hypothetical protein
VSFGGDDDPFELVTLCRNQKANRIHQPQNYAALWKRQTGGFLAAQ